LPGLYLFSSLPLRFISVTFNIDINKICNEVTLRYTNVIYILLMFILVFKFNKYDEYKQDDLKRILNSLAIILFPLNYFFQFLYYTDVGSTYFSLLMIYYVHNKSTNFIKMILIGTIAILFRQTNIIWVVFCLGLAILHQIERLSTEKSKKMDKKISILLKILTNKAENGLKMPKEFDLKTLLNDTVQIIFSKSILSYFILLTAFCLFVFLNNGIVVGDRSNHEACIHLCQIFYFATFSIGFVIIHHINIALSCLKLLLKSIRFLIISVFLMALFCLIVNRFTYEHKFLLSDNRHYTFYIWSKIYRRHYLIKYLLVPIYYLALLTFGKVFIKNGKSIGWILVYIVCTIACLVPQKLLEFRYFIIPFMLFRLNFNLNSLTRTNLIIEILFNLTINLVTLYTFMNRTFLWPNSGELQRFMW
jgi:alpha-1,2-glucosyltransferase